VDYEGTANIQVFQKVSRVKIDSDAKARKIFDLSIIPARRKKRVY